MRVALLHKHYDPAHLERVIAEMKILGTPTIHAVWIECYGHYAALEGCHRLRAAKILGLEPEIIEVDYDSSFETDQDGFIPVSELVDDSYRAEEITF